MKTALRLSLIVVFVVSLFTPGSFAFAQGEECQPGSTICAPGDSVEIVNGQATAVFKSAYSAIVKGGYVAHGVGMRNTGYGSIRVSDVPAGATVAKAYLFWAVVGRSSAPGFYYYKGKINGYAISGTLLGSTGEPGWDFLSRTYGYRADVTARMYKGGNGLYDLSNFASFYTDGRDPFSSGSAVPMVEGATLVIVYRQLTGPNTLVKIMNGPTYVENHEMHLNFTGINASGMTGLTKTTFIGADGQSNLAEPSSYFFTEPLASVTWDGGDPNGAGHNYTNGNLWDTHTVDLTFLLDPPENDFWFSVGGGPDAVVWVAQVVSYATGNQDSDGDKLRDYYELFGYGSQNLPGWGADPLRKDLFVEADYMNGHDHLPPVAQLDDIVNVFADAPVMNPDGSTGISIHIDTGGAAYGVGSGTYSRFNLGGGGAVPEDANLGTADAACNNYDWNEFQVLKNDYFYYQRSGIFHYMIFAHNLAPCFGTVSGISRNGWPDSTFAKGAQDFIVSLGGWSSMGTAEQREGTFIHELGHNLGLRHGGNDHVNYKPNYLSVMNYAFQMPGVIRDGTSGHYDYSRFQLPSLNEGALVEANGLGSLATYYGTRTYGCSTTTRSATTITYAGSNIDWNCNGVVSGTVADDINFDGSRTTLGTQNNWANVTFLGGGVIGVGVDMGEKASSLMITRTDDCLTYEDWLLHNEE